METRKQVEATKVLERGLSVLEHVIEAGFGTVRQVSDGVGMSRPATYRIMESLKRCGYVRRDSYRESYKLTSKVLDLCGVISPAVLVCEAARPIMLELTHRTGWPVLLGQIDDTELVVLESTDRQARHHLKRIASGDRQPQSLRAAGAVCRASLDLAEARRLSKAIIEKYGDQLFSRDEDYRERLLDRVRARGFVVFEPLRSKEGSVAVPLKLANGSVFGLEMRFIAAMLKGSSLKTQLIPMLERVTSQIARRADVLVERRNAARPPARS